MSVIKACTKRSIEVGIAHTSIPKGRCDMEKTGTEVPTHRKSTLSLDSDSE